MTPRNRQILLARLLSTRPYAMSLTFFQGMMRGSLVHGGSRRGWHLARAAGPEHKLLFEYAPDTTMDKVVRDYNEWLKKYRHEGGHQ